MSKTQVGTNGVTWRWVVGVLLLLCASLAAGSATYLKGEVDDVAELIDGHTDRPGHPVLVERVDRMQHDIQDIKTEQREIQHGVTELLRRVPPK